MANANEFLFVFITLEPTLVGLLRFWTNPEIQDGEPRGPPLRNGYAIMTSRRHFQT